MALVPSATDTRGAEDKMVRSSNDRSRSRHPIANHDIESSMAQWWQVFVGVLGGTSEAQRFGKFSSCQKKIFESIFVSTFFEDGEIRLLPAPLFAVKIAIAQRT